MITRQMTPFFHLLFELYPLVFLISAFNELQNSIPWRLLLALCSGLRNKHLRAIYDTFKLFIIFFYIEFANFWYVTYFVPHLIPIWLQSHVLFPPK